MQLNFFMSFGTPLTLAFKRTMALASRLVAQAALTKETAQHAPALWRNDAIRNDVAGIFLLAGCTVISAGCF